MLLYCRLKTAFFKIFTISRRKCIFYQIHSWIKTLSLNCFCLHCGLERAICQIFTISSKKIAFCIKSTHGIQIFFENCLAPLWVESRVFPNLHHFSSKNAFYIKSTRKLKLFLENCVLHYGELKTAFRQIFTNSR